jgi:hypothetical protein
MFLLLSTPAEIVQKCQKLDTDGDFNDSFSFPHDDAIQSKDSGGTKRKLMKITTTDDVMMGNVEGTVNLDDIRIKKRDDATKFYVFETSSGSVAKIDNNGDYSSDAGSTFVDVSATIPQYLKNTQTDATEYSTTTQTPSWDTLVTLTALSPTNAHNIVLGCKVECDIKAGIATNNANVKVEISDGTNTHTTDTLTEAGATYVTHSLTERITTLVPSASYTIVVKGNTANSSSTCYMEALTVVVYYLDKCQED